MSSLARAYEIAGEAMVAAALSRTPQAVSLRNGCSWDPGQAPPSDLVRDVARRFARLRHERGKVRELKVRILLNAPGSAATIATVREHLKRQQGAVRDFAKRLNGGDEIDQSELDDAVVH